MIIRRKHTGNFAVIPNSTANDEGLSADTLGVLAYLLSKPSDWMVQVLDLRNRFKMGRDRVYAIIRELEGSGYVKRHQSRSGDSNQFKTVEYVVFDCPQSTPGGEPLPEIPEAAIQRGNEGAASGFPVYGKSGHILKTESTKPSSKENSVSAATGGEPPSTSSEIWKEGLSLLGATSLSDKQKRTIIGRWCKGAPSEENKKALLAIFRAARRAGTGDPVAYIAKAVNQAFPPPPDPNGFDDATWRRNIQAAINMRSWSLAWGPPPGAKGCKVPAGLISPELTVALQAKRKAA